MFTHSSESIVDIIDVVKRMKSYIEGSNNKLLTISTQNRTRNDKSVSIRNNVCFSVYAS